MGTKFSFLCYLSYCLSISQKAVFHWKNNFTPIESNFHVFILDIIELLVCIEFFFSMLLEQMNLGFCIF